MADSSDLFDSFADFAADWSRPSASDPWNTHFESHAATSSARPSDQSRPLFSDNFFELDPLTAVPDHGNDSAPNQASLVASPYRDKTTGPEDSMATEDDAGANSLGTTEPRTLFGDGSAFTELLREIPRPDDPTELPSADDRATTRDPPSNNNPNGVASLDRHSAASSEVADEEGSPPPHLSDNGADDDGKENADDDYSGGRDADDEYSGERDADDEYNEGYQDYLEGTRYEFRPAAREKPLPGGATWLDHDQSGNYDPSNKRDVWPIESTKRKRREVPTSGDASPRPVGPKKPKTALAARQNGEQFIVTLKLQSEHAKAILQRYPDCCPNEYWNFLVDDLPSSPYQSAGSENGTAHVQMRTRHMGARSDTRLARHPHEQRQEDLTGHPSARGCKACRNFGQTCPMLEPDGTYPCTFCIEDECDCELLLEPKRKRSCQGCRRRRVRCSYVDSTDHSKACLGCQELGHRCVAGPYIDRTRTRIGHDGKPATIHEDEPRYRKPAASDVQGPGRKGDCASCRQAGKQCTSKCSNSGQGCQRGGKIPHRPQSKDHAATSHHATAEPGLDDEAQDFFRKLASTAQAAKPAQTVEPITRSPLFDKLTSPPGRIETIRTRLVHPITFNATTDAKQPCHWCADPLYGIFGVGDEAQVTVRQWPNGRGCTELSREQKPGGLQGSRMCADCTMDRLLILTCDEHEIRAVDGLTAEDGDWEVQLGLLMDCGPKGAARGRLERRFCSVCPKLAVAECQTESENGRGCGLRLCEACAHMYQWRFGGDLQVLARDVDAGDSKYYPFGLRADCDFFKPNSYLVRQVLLE